jgi:hypothetical protein
MYQSIPPMFRISQDTSELDKDSAVVGPAWLPGPIQRGVRYADT